MGTPVLMEPSLKYHPGNFEVLTQVRYPDRGQCMVGSLISGLLPKSNGGVRRCAQTGRKSVVEYKGKSALDCETNTSSRYESRS